MIDLTEDNPQEALRTLLRRLNAKFTDYSISNLRQHPDYPSLLAINHTLNQLQIDNIAVRGTYEQLQNEFPKPLLVHTQENGGAYRVVEQVDEEKVSFVDERGRLRVQPKDDFLKIWSGVTMLVDEQTKGAEKDYALNRVKDFINKARLPGAVIGFLLLVFYVVYFTDNLSAPFDYLFLGTKALGIVATDPLMVRLVDKQNPWAKKLCHSPKAGSNVNCASILDDPAATLLGVFAWSEIGFLYFTVLFAYLLLFPVNVNVLVVGLAILAAPYTVYSLYYQWKVARQWCRLCLAVQAVLLLELALAIIFLVYPLDPLDLQSVVALVLVSALILTVYSFLKPILIERNNDKKQLRQLHKIKYQPEVFQALLSKSPKMNTTGIAPIQLGNPKGKHQLTIISNPTCGPCINMHRKLFEMLKGKENVSLQEIFLTAQNENSRDYQIAECMVKLYQSNEVITAKDIIAVYYNDSKDWLRKHDQTTTLSSTKAKHTLGEHITWCRKKKVSSTPTVLYNGHELPKEYQIEDLNYLLD